MKIQYKGFMRERTQKNPVTIGPDASFFDARKLVLEKGVRHVPVVDKKNKLVGIVTDRDIREAAPSDATTLSFYELNYLLENLKVSAFMTPREKVLRSRRTPSWKRPANCCTTTRSGVCLF